MAKNYQVGLVIKGNAKGGVSAVKATKDELTKLNSKQKRFQYETKKTNDSIGKMAGKFGLLKASVIGAVASIASITLGKQFIDDFTQQEQAVSLLDASIGSMGRTTVGLSSQLQKLASQIQKEGIIGDEVLIKGQSFLTTYKDITDELLPRTTRVMADLTAKMGGDAVRAANLLGKASMGLTGALSIAGISLSEATKKSKDFEAILGEIEDQVGGTNKALGSASTGGFTQFSNALGDVRENIGEILTIALGDHFRGWSLEIGITKENIQSFGSALKVLVASLATLGKIVMVGGALVLGFKAITIAVTLAAAAKRFLAMNVLATSMAYTAGVGPLALFTTSLIASTAATWSAITAFGVLKTVTLGLFAAFAGWEIGSLLREQFVEVRIAGLAFVGAMETGLVNLSYSFSAIAPKAKQVWGELTTYLKNKLGSLYSLIADGLANVGADDMAKGYRDFSESLSGSSDTAKAAKKELALLNEQRNKDIETIDKIIVSLINFEYAQEKSTKATQKNTSKSKDKISLAKSELTTNQKLIASLQNQLKISKLTGIKKLEEINLSKLSSEIKDGEIAKIKELTAALYEQSQIDKQKQSDSDYYQKIIDGANDIGESWSAAGNVIVNTFGTIGEQLDKLAQQQENYAKKQKKLAADKVKYADDPKKLGEIGKAENSLAKQKAGNAMSEISSYRAITDSAASMFSEHSKGRKAMQAASDVFTAIELANSALRIGSYAIEAITAAFAAPWPIGFASGAAMIAIIAGLGVAVSGGSGSAPASSEERQKTQSTGTVLGSDEKSQSLNNSFERIEELELDQYAVLREMNTSLHDLNNNITHLATSFVSNFGKFNSDSYGGDLGESHKWSGKIAAMHESGTFLGDPVGDFLDSIVQKFSTKKRSLVDSGISIVSQTLGDIINSGLVQAQAYFDVKTKKKSFWGLSSKTSYNTETQDVNEQLKHELALIFADIGSSITSAVDVLGFDLTRSLDSFVIDLPNISFKDLSGDEIQAELQAMFSSQADLMATYLIPGLAEFQQVGEGLYETLIRLAQEQAVFNSVLELTGNTFASVDANQTIAATQAIIGYAGGIEVLQSAAGTFFNEFYSEAEQFEYMQKQLNAQFTALGLTVPKTKEGFRDLVSALDPLNEADQKLYAQLLLLSGQTSEYYDALENQIDAEKELSDARKSFTDDIQTQLERLDMSPLQIQLEDLQNSFLNSFNEAQELGLETALLEELYARNRQKIIDDALAKVNDAHERSMDTLTRDHEKAVNELISNNDKLVSAFSSLNASIASGILSIRRQGEGWSESNYQSTQVSDLSSLLGQGSISDQIGNIDSLQQAHINKYNAELASINASRDATRSAYDEQLANIETRYQAELEVYNSMRSALDSLKEAVDSLLLSDFSTLTNAERLTESKNQYQSTLAAAKGGDADAVAQLSTSQNNYLAEAQKYYASSSAYQDIFDQVIGEASNIANTSLVAPTEPSALPVPEEIREHNAAIQELQLSTIAELTGLRELSAELELQNQESFDLAMTDLAFQLEVNSALLIEQLDADTLEINAQAAANTQELNTTLNNQLTIVTEQNVLVVEQTTAIHQMNRDVTDELGSVVKMLGEQNEALNARIKQEEAKSQAADARADSLMRQLNNQAETQERMIDEIMTRLDKAG